GVVVRRATSIEVVPAMRLALYGGNVHAIHDVLAVTKASERDLDFLLALLERGTARDRISVLELIDEHTLDSPRIAEAVRRAREDLEDQTAEAARRLCSYRGW